VQRGRGRGDGDARLSAPRADLSSDYMLIVRNLLHHLPKGETASADELDIAK
jgi:hypothetical protein